MAIRRSEYLIGTTAEWTAAYFPLPDGQLGVDTDTNVVKMGDGTSTWAQLGPVSVTNARLAQAVEDAITGLVPGTEVGYAEVLTNLTTTAAAYPGTVLPGLGFTVVGKGRPVDIEFFTPGAYHSVANTGVTAMLRVNNVPLGPMGQLAGAFSPITTNGEVLIMKRRILLVNATSYAFTVHAYGSAAGTTTLIGATSAPMYLSATSR